MAATQPRASEHDENEDDEANDSKETADQGDDDSGESDHKLHSVNDEYANDDKDGDRDDKKDSKHKDGDRDDKKDSKHESSPLSEFAVKLFQTVSKEYEASDKSFFMSPFSVWQTLNLAYYGSAGDTKKQLKDELYRGQKETDYKKMGADLQHLVKVIDVMNKIYITKESQLKKSILDNMIKAIIHDPNKLCKHIRVADCNNDDVKESCPNLCRESAAAAGNSDKSVSQLKDYIMPVDFHATTEVVDIINNDVSDATKGLIPTIIEKDFLISDTKMVIVNAIHFKADWKTKFDKKLTSKEEFHYLEGKEKQTEKVDMMKITTYFNFTKSKAFDCSIVEVPYLIHGAHEHKSSMSMYVFLPDEGKTVNDLMEKMGPKQLLHELPKLRRQKVKLNLPKFKMEVTIENELKKGLKTMGLFNMFDESKADFSEFFEKKISGLYVSKIIHKAMVEIDEEGTTAAAAMALGLATRSRGPDTMPFICNKPFVFMIVDKKYYNPIFTGVFKNPKHVQT
ncbi:unnamed protein product, partial [Meganyctiphanes norvegica]